MRKVMTLVGTRPELIKMSRVISELDRHTDHVLVHTGQNYDYELNEVFFKELDIRQPDIFLGATGDTPAAMIGEIIRLADEAFATVKPEALLLYGDTNSCLSVIPAKRRKIPVFHMEAGNRSFDQRVPEELNRKIIDHASDINLVLTEHARRYLMAEGIRPETIIKTGSHMQEVLAHYMPRVLASDVLSRTGLQEGQYFIVSAHREENVDDPALLQTLLETFRALHREYGYPVVVSTHPRTRKRLESLGEVEGEGIRFLKPFGLIDYLRLQMGAFCVVSDSGTITEEASLLNLPAVTIRTAHERPEGMDAGTLVMSGLGTASVLDSVRLVTEQHNASERAFPIVGDYEGGSVSKQVVRIVLSYIDYINRTVWYRT